MSIKIDHEGEVSRFVKILPKIIMQHQHGNIPHMSLHVNLTALTNKFDLNN